MRDADALSRLGGATLGVWRRRDALRILTRDELAHDLDEGTVRAPLPGVLVDGGSALSPAQWLAAAVLASSGNRPVGCGRTSARVLGIPLVDDHDPATRAYDENHHDVAVVRHLRDLTSRPHPLRPLDVLHRHQLRLTPGDVVRHESGLLLTTHLRTLYDLSSLVSADALVCALDWCLHHGHVTREQLSAYAETVKGWRSAPSFRRAIELADGRAESPHESLTRMLLKPGWPQLTPQVRLVDGRGRPVARFDHADEELRLAVESDGRQGHSGELMKARDDGRDRRTWHQHGYRTERVTWFQVRRQPAQTRARLLAVRDALRSERRRPAAS